MPTSDARFKVNALIKLANVTTDYCERERYCREAKYLLDGMKPIIDINTDVAMQFIDENYEITLEKHDKVLKREFDKAFLEWGRDKGFMFAKKEVTARLSQLGVKVNPRGNYGNRRGVYVYEGLKPHYGRQDPARQESKGME